MSRVERPFVIRGPRGLLSECSRTAVRWVADESEPHLRFHSKRQAEEVRADVGCERRQCRVVSTIVTRMIGGLRWIRIEGGWKHQRWTIEWYPARKMFAVCYDDSPAHWLNAKMAPLVRMICNSPEAPDRWSHVE